eukprot:4853151-Pyramimonas_sp.AAC.1
MATALNRGEFDRSRTQADPDHACGRAQAICSQHALANRSVQGCPETPLRTPGCVTSSAPPALGMAMDRVTMPVARWDHGRPGESRTS